MREKETGKKGELPQRRRRSVVVQHIHVASAARPGHVGVRAERGPIQRDAQFANAVDALAEKLGDEARDKVLSR
jgi:hypothetical protein